MTYLIHFHRPYKHARHYIGFARDAKTFAKRIEHHAKGSGARLMSVIVAAGIDFEVARTWADGTRDFERKLKNRHGAGKFCPLCQAARQNAKDARQPATDGRRRRAA